MKEALKISLLAVVLLAVMLAGWEKTGEEGEGEEGREEVGSNGLFFPGEKSIYNTRGVLCTPPRKKGNVA